MTDVRLEIAMRVLPVLIEQDIRFQAYRQPNEGYAFNNAAEMALNYADTLFAHYLSRYPQAPPE